MDCVYVSFPPPLIPDSIPILYHLAIAFVTMEIWLDRMPIP